MDDKAAVNIQPLAPLEGAAGFIDRFEYRADSPIADGGFAYVYWARDRQSETDVALKVLKPEYEENMVVVDSFFRDPRIALQLDHPNIVKILNIGDSDTRPYFFAMEYCSMGDLRKWIQRTRRLSIARALRYAVGICDALQYCHASDVFHRDIKASNILFKNTHTPVLSDFGNALDEIRFQVDEGREENVGSPPYMSPEAWQRQGYTAASDLYSFGVLLYYMITGVLPFSGTTPEEFKKMHLFTTPATPSKWRASVTKPLDEVILSLLEKRPKDRITSVAEVRSLLDQIYRDSYEGIDAVTNAAVKIFLEDGTGSGISPQEYPFSIGKGDAGSKDSQNYLKVGARDPYVSRCHAVIERFEDGFFFIDMSTNGSWVNGTRLHKQSIELVRENKVLVGKETAFVIKVSGGEKSGDEWTRTLRSEESPRGRLPMKPEIILGASVVLLVLGYLVKLILS